MLNSYYKCHSNSENNVKTVLLRLKRWKNVIINLLIYFRVTLVQSDVCCHSMRGTKSNLLDWSSIPCCQSSLISADCVLRICHHHHIIIRITLIRIVININLFFYLRQHFSQWMPIDHSFLWCVIFNFITRKNINP